MSIRQWWKERGRLRDLEITADKLRADMNSAVKTAKARGANAAEIHEIEQEYHSSIWAYQDRFNVLNSRRLIREARKLLIPVPQMSPDSDAWDDISQSGGGWALSEKGFFELRNAVRAERKLRRDDFFGWAAAITGIVGALTGLIAVVLQFF